MRLKEFIDKNGNKVTLPKNTPSGNTSIGSFKERFEKLLEYTSKHKNPNTKNITTENLTDDTLEFTEHYYDGSSVSYEIYIGPLTEAWRFKVYTDGDFSHPIDHMSGMEWSELLKELRYYIVLPVVGTPEYKNILKEFLDAKGNKVNLPKQNSSGAATKTAAKTNKEKFEKLIEYIEDYQVPYIKKTETLRLNDISLLYKIYRKPPKVKEYTVTLELHYSRFLDDWQFTIYKNDINIDDFTGKGWEELLKALRVSEFGVYTIIPKPGSKEHDSLCEAAELQEFVDKNGNQVKIPRAYSSNAPVVSKTSNNSNKDKFVKLIYHMMKDKLSCVTDVKCDRVDEDGFTYTEARSTNIGDYVLKLIVSYNKDNSWKYDLYIDTSLVETHEGTGMKELLWRLSSYFSVPFHKSAEYKDICESTSSIAADFKEYENLWD